MRKLMKQYGVPKVMITGKLRSYDAAIRKLVPGLEHRSHKGLNNAAEVSHKPTRLRERVMGKFNSARMHNNSSPHLIRLRFFSNPVATNFPQDPTAMLD